jgi:hypothetical protein
MYATDAVSQTIDHATGLDLILGFSHQEKDISHEATNTVKSIFAVPGRSSGALMSTEAIFKW